MGAGARADSAIYAVIAVGVAVFMTVRGTRAFLLKAIAASRHSCIVAVAFYLVANQSSVASGGPLRQHAASASRWRRR